MYKVALALAAVLATATAAGCGSAAKPVATLTQFAAQANEICVTLSQEQAAIETRSRVPGKTGQAVWQEIVTVSRAADIRVKALPKPPAQADTIDRLIAGYFEEAQDEDNIANAYGSGNTVAVETAYTTLIGLARRDAAVARSLGMIDCAKAGSASSASPA